MKKFLLTVVFAFIGFMGFSQERIAVFPFEDMDNVLTQNEATLFYRQFSNEFTNRNSGRFAVVPRQDIERLINAEAVFQMSEFSARTKTAEMQRVLNGTRILSGLIGRVGNNIHITVSLYTYPDLQQLSGGADLTVPNKTELFNKIPELVQKMQGEGQTVYRIGDIGPAGGIVFYDKGVFTEGWRYLEAAPALSEFIVSWDTQYDGYLIGFPFPIWEGEEYVCRTEVGRGKRNTQVIAGILNQRGYQGVHAAQICARMDTNGFRDWFLPSSGELILMYKNLRAQGVGGFSNEYYCSSSLAGHFFYYVYFGNPSGALDGIEPGGGPIYDGSINRVRAIRQF